MDNQSDGGDKSSVEEDMSDDPCQSVESPNVDSKDRKYEEKPPRNIPPQSEHIVVKSEKMASNFGNRDHFSEGEEGHSGVAKNRVSSSDDSEKYEDQKYGEFLGEWLEEQWKYSDLPPTEATKIDTDEIQRKEDNESEGNDLNSDEEDSQLDSCEIDDDETSLSQNIVSDDVESDEGKGDSEGEESEHDEQTKKVLEALQRLGPSHPLLRPLQEARRKKLTEEKQNLVLSVRQKTLQTERLRQENVEAGVQILHTQENIAKSQVHLEHLKDTRESLHSSRISTEKRKQEARHHEAQLYASLSLSLNEDRLLRKQLSNLDNRLALLRQALQQSDDDFMALKNALQTSRKDRLKTETVKNEQDFMVERLRSNLEVEKLTLETLASQLLESQQRTKQLQKISRDNESQLADLQSSISSIYSAWREGVLLLQKRSQSHASAQLEYETQRSYLAGLNSENFNLKKDVFSVQMQHQRYSHRLTRSENELVTRQQKLLDLQEKLSILSEKHQDLEGKLEEKEKQIGALKQRSNEVKQVFELNLQRLSKLLQHLRAAKELEEDRVSEHKLTTKAVQADNRRLRHLNIQILDMEGKTCDIQQKSSSLTSEIANIRDKIMGLHSTHEKFNHQTQEAGINLTRIEAEYKNAADKLHQHLAAIDRCKKNIERVTTLREAANEGPLEVRIDGANTQLEGVLLQRRRLEKQAICLQSRLLDQEETIHGLQENISARQTELRVAADRYRRLENNAEAKKNELLKSQKNHEDLNGRVKRVDSEFLRQEIKRNDAAHENMISQTLFMAKLKELETRTSKKLLRVSDTKNKLEEFQCSVWKCEADLQEWKQKVDTLLETKAKVNETMGKQGKLDDMKTEINRMKVRWREIECRQKLTAGNLARTVDSEDIIRDKGKAMLAKLCSDPAGVTATKEMKEEAHRRKMRKVLKAQSDLSASVSFLTRETEATEADCMRQERHYSLCVRQLQSAAKQLQDLLQIRDKRSVQLSTTHIRSRHLTGLLSGQYRPLAAGSEEAQRNLRTRLVAKQESYIAILSQLNDNHEHLSHKLALLYAYVEDENSMN